MLEDLIKLKKDLEKEQKFVVITDNNKHIDIGTTEMTLSQIEEKENTDGFILECEELMKKVILFFTERGIPFSSIMISSSIGFFSKQNVAKEIQSRMSKGLDTERLVLCNMYGGNILAKLVPVTFSLNLGGCYIPDEFVPSNIKDPMTLRYLYDYGSLNTDKSIGSLLEQKVSGTVDFDKFIHKLNELGYDIELLNYGKISSFQEYTTDYFDAVNHDKFTILNIKANLTPKKEIKNEFGSR